MTERVVLYFLESVRGAGERQDITDVLDAREVHDHALEAQAVTGMLHAAELAQLRYQS